MDRSASRPGSQRVRPHIAVGKELSAFCSSSLLRAGTARAPVVVSRCTPDHIFLKPAPFPDRRRQTLQVILTGDGDSSQSRRDGRQHLDVEELKSPLAQALVQAE